jgi:excisionase family DNA binding protein
MEFVMTGWIEIDGPMPLHEPITVPEAEQAQVEELRKLLQLGAPELVGPDGKERISLPPSIYRALKNVVRNLQRGRTVILIPEDEEFTTQTAANFLGVSRPHLIKLLETEHIPFHRTGSHRRILLRHLMEYAKKRDAERKKILGELAKDAFSRGLYDSASMPEGGQDE